MPGSVSPSRSRCRNERPLQEGHDAILPGRVPVCPQADLHNGPARAFEGYVPRRKMMNSHWPKSIMEWHEKDTGFVSVPFTWLLPEALGMLRQRRFGVSEWIVGGPAVQLMPAYLQGVPHVAIGTDSPGVLQRANPMATRTTQGCPRSCSFCGVRTIEGPFIELDDWPDLPILCDSNLLNASAGHLDRVFARLRRWGWCDFNQGIDCRLLQPETAKAIAAIGKPLCRMALDHDALRNPWTAAVDMLRSAGVPKSLIRTYVIIGAGDDPDCAWDRCEFVQSHGVLALPMWYHPLDALEQNRVTPEQHRAGWSERERLRIMGYYYKHRGSPPCRLTAPTAPPGLLRRNDDLYR